MPFFMVSSRIQAHGGEAEYVKINQQYIPGNPLLSIAIPSKFFVGSESTSSAYLVDKEIVFEIDEESFPNPYLPRTNGPNKEKDQLSKPVFQWDFSDGSEKIEGSKVHHIYKKPGTYIVKIFSKFQGKEDEYRQINTVQIDIVPDGNYIRPQARILVNGKEVSNTTRDAVTLTPGRNIQFDASKSTGNSISYEWDFGDSQGGKTSRIAHRFPRDEYYPVAVLRVTDELGISNDTYVALDMPYTNLNIVSKFFYGVYDFFVGSVLKL